MVRSVSVALFAVVALSFASNAAAAPITVNAFTTVYGASGLPLGNPGPQLQLINGAVGSVNVSSIPLSSYIVADWSIDVTSFTTNPGPVNINPSLSNTFTITGAALDTGGVVTFQFVTSPTGSSSLVPPTTTGFTGYVQVIAITGAFTAYDFGPIGTYYSFDGTIQNTTLNTNGTVSQNPVGNSSSFTFIRLDGEPSPGDATPEPATLAVLGLMGAFGGIAVRRKLRAAA